eukprot:TRINITY_DN2796_c0_g1_i2.p1 TRINITY_DN2796_c0_g1~~TRINITY_DN2796_c0_g1_i2.p1  ORF type:complete len:139 (-),score=34.82 TRINITY_DN2796_c0_g1_i2:174-590(-)
MNINLFLNNDRLKADLGALRESFAMTIGSSNIAKTISNTFFERFETEKFTDLGKKWFLYLSHEPSLGLYFIQMHFADYIKRQEETREQNENVRRKLEFTIMDMKNTEKEIDEMATLNGAWSQNMSVLLDKLHGKMLIK